MAGGKVNRPRRKRRKRSTFRARKWMTEKLSGEVEVRNGYVSLVRPPVQPNKRDRSRA